MADCGMLYMVATPIGNLEDMTFRAIRILKEADLIAAEDTRGSIRLLNHFDIHTPMTSYHEYNKVAKARTLVDRMLEGQTVACVTDAGTPGISDPGEVLVQMAMEAGIRVVPVPGACAAVNALISSGQATRRFCFEAFLPSEKKEREAVLEELKEETRTIVLYEAPHRLVRTLQILLDALGDRSMSICRELTKKHEEIFRTTIAGALELYHEQEPRGEYVLVIAGRDRRELIESRQEAVRSELTLQEHMRRYEESGMDRKEAMKAVAKDRGISKREVYAQLLQSGEASEERQ
ncbi:MAG: 16S rRNA (cytidine(1402)-2'-O)-methyltransferase [Lachnospiraceae bacterium]|nr:16S rRNA (cytidine(1402)-2'-O)-methyltransferase [Lachnospiraceae bacterium]